MNHIRTLFLLTGAAVALSSCTKQYDNPPAYTLVAPGDIAITHTIKQLKTLYKGQPLTIDSTIVISGVINGTDETGNLYRELYIQDATSGIKVKIGKTGLYNDYKLGQTLYIQCKGLQLGAYGGMVELGYQSANTKYETAYIDAEYLIKQHVLRGQYGEEPVAREVALDALAANPDWLGTLVTFRNVRFSGRGSTTAGAITIPTWAAPTPDDGSDPTTVNQVFLDSNSRELTVRTSGYCRFAGSRIPLPDTAVPADQPVSLTGILSVYSGAYQLTLRSLDDVAMN
jgi:hypothetical protein